MNDNKSPGTHPSDENIRQQVASNIRAWRRIRHLTQIELARRIGIQAGPMNALEQGRHVPSGRVLYRLADVLEVSVDAVLGRLVPGSEPAEQTPAGAPRVAKTAPAYATVEKCGDDWPSAVSVALRDDPPFDAATRSTLNEILHAFLALEDLCGAQKRAHIPLYLPFTATATGLETLTQQVRQILGVGQAVVFDYLELLENAGLRIVFCPLPASVQSAAFHDAANANAFLIVRDGMNVERQLFELAKRLGAIYLHTRDAYCPSPAVPVSELLDDLHAARKFAALFLMPAAAVRASVAQLGIAPDGWTYELLLRLKHRFGVSAQSFVMRLKELGLIDPVVSAGIETRIERHYQRTHYSEPDATRRILSPNGRLGDLLLAALQKPEAKKEARSIAATLRELGLEWNRPRKAGRTRSKVSSKA